MQKLKNSKKKPSNTKEFLNEFKIDKKECLKDLEAIKRGDKSNFKELTPKELFKEVGI